MTDAELLVEHPFTWGFRVLFLESATGWLLVIAAVLLVWFVLVPLYRWGSDERDARTIDKAQERFKK